MMSRSKVSGLLILVVAFAVGAFFVRALFAGRNAVVHGTKTVVAAPSHSATEEQRAEQKSERQAIEADCAALRKLGTNNKYCPK